MCVMVVSTTIGSMIIHLTTLVLHVLITLLLGCGLHVSIVFYIGLQAIGAWVP